jgi:hypothetical protein
MSHLFFQYYGVAGYVDLPLEGGVHRVNYAPMYPHLNKPLLLLASISKFGYFTDD